MAKVSGSLVDAVISAQNFSTYERLNNNLGPQIWNRLPLPEALASVGYQQRIQVPSNQGSWLIAERRDYVPFSFVPPKEAPVQTKSGVAFHQQATTGMVDYAFLTRPGEPVSLEEMAGNARIISSEVMLSEKELDSKLARLSVIGVPLGCLVGAAVMYLFHPHARGVDLVFNEVVGGLAGAGVAAIGVIQRSSWLFSHRQKKGVNELHNPESYSYGYDAAITTLSEFESARKEAALAGSYQVATESGLAMPREDFQAAWYRIKHLKETPFGGDVLGLLATPHLLQVMEAIKVHEEASRPSVTP